MPPSKNISFDELSKYFHLPINQVAKELGVCATILKKICRRNGIPRWPHRKIKSLDKMISNLEVNLAKNPTEREEINHEVELLKTKKLEIMKNPDILVSKSSSRGHSRGNLSGNMKKTKPNRGGMYTVNTFKVKELSQAEDEEYSSEDTNCWAAPSPTLNRSERSAKEMLAMLSDQVGSQIQAARRPSLPILDVHHLPAPVAAPSINLPFPGRRHSLDIIPSRNPSSFSLSASSSSATSYHSAPAIDFSQKLPAFQFKDTTASTSLPCIEPSMNAPSIQESPLNIFPDWFIAEKNRVLGHD